MWSALHSLKAPALRRFATSATIRSSVSTKGVTFKGTTYPYHWLRDSCQCPQCVHPTNQQKLHRTSDIPVDVRPERDSLQLSDDGIRVTWGPDHTAFYPSGFLERYSDSSKLQQYHHDVDPASWDQQQIQSVSDLFMDYGELDSPAGLLRALTQLSRYGLIFVTGVSPVETSDDKCEARRLAERFAYLRETFYGDTWDVMLLENSKNIAYTNLHLGFHMDLLHFQHPPRYQLLHCLRNRVQGGTSVFVDSLHAANRLYETHPADFALLATTPVPFQYIVNGKHIHDAKPTLELDLAGYTGAHTGPGAPRVRFVNYSPPWQAPLPVGTPPAFYGALARFAALLDDPAMAYQYTLREGDGVLFDNRRVLHARTAFSERPGAPRVPGEPSRWLKGCYFDADEVLTRRRMLEKELMGESS
ncbi:Clavaminate synthase-like protein [Phanerochaete sordida]|uniref:Clavaminate synthase-like protein n=1 Tax=Phanerochaete sordida TaxID=48140 RepID=A0A9P3GKP4_9APHY|nr:Clavaminate synthase-like protein [Phanerochaete sordida]